MQVVNGRTYKVDGVPILQLPPEKWPENAVYIGRAGHGWSGYFGNPCKNEPLAVYRQWLDAKCDGDQEFRNAVALLWRQDATLVCFCKPRACHGDVLAAKAAELNGIAGDVASAESGPSVDDFCAALDAIIDKSQQRIGQCNDEDTR